MKYFGRERKISKENIFSRGRVFTFTRMVLHPSHEIQRYELLDNCTATKTQIHSTVHACVCCSLLAWHCYTTLCTWHICACGLHVLPRCLYQTEVYLFQPAIFLGVKYDAKGIANNFLTAHQSIRILVENFYRYVLSRTARNIWKLGRTQATHIQWEWKVNIRLEGTKLIQKYIC